MENEARLSLFSAENVWECEAMAKHSALNKGLSDDLQGSLQNAD
jgi:hypothetical protein